MILLIGKNLLSIPDYRCLMTVSLLLKNVIFEGKAGKLTELNLFFTYTLTRKINQQQKF